MLRGVIDVTWAELHAVNTKVEIDFDAFKLQEDTSKSWPTHGAEELEGAAWRPLKSAN